MKPKAELIAQAEILEWADTRAGLICIAEKAAEYRRQAAALPEQEPVSHTDHPSRHWDRTCPACNTEHTAAEGTTTQGESPTVATNTAVGVPDLIERLNASYYRSGFAVHTWPLPNLHEEAAEALAALQDQAKDFHMVYRMKCDAETKQQAQRIKELEFEVRQLEMTAAQVDDGQKRHVARLEAERKEMRELLATVVDPVKQKLINELLERTK